MAMIQGIDGAALLNAFRQGREDRYASEQRKLQIAQQQNALDRQKQANGLAAQVFGGAPPQDSGGVAGMAGVQPQGQIDTAQPAMQPTTQPATQPTQQAQPNMQAFARLATIDPERAGQIATAIKTMHETEIKTLDAKNMAMAQSAHWLANQPADKRAEYMRTLIAPHLKEAGWTDQELQQANLSDQGLQHYQLNAMDMDKILSAELAERKFQAGDIVTPQPGAGAFRVKPNGQTETIVAPNDGSHAAGTVAGSTGASGIPQAAADYLRQHPELKDQFDAKYGAGASAQVLGGGAGNGAGGFQP